MIFVYLSDFSILVLIKALHEEVWTLYNFEKLVLGQSPILSSQADHPVSLHLVHNDAVLREDAKVVIEGDAASALLVNLEILLAVKGETDI